MGWEKGFWALDTECGVNIDESISDTATEHTLRMANKIIKRNP